ncbi:hypothetical protein BKA57DRAFT_474999 [Linnemannia elongata]|nr:hypothetical protein BKA57DRAFT_474999 [Linnemannia elongata]
MINDPLNSEELFIFSGKEHPNTKYFFLFFIFWWQSKSIKASLPSSSASLLHSFPFFLFILSFFLVIRRQSFFTFLFLFFLVSPCIASHPLAPYTLYPLRLVHYIFLFLYPFLTTTTTSYLLLPPSDPFSSNSALLPLFLFVPPGNLLHLSYPFSALSSAASLSLFLPHWSPFFKSVPSSSSPTLCNPHLAARISPFLLNTKREKERQRDKLSHARTHR